MEIVNRDGRRWPDPESGPFDLWTTFAIIDGRPEVVGVELWAVDPSALPRGVTHLTPKEAEGHWPREPDPSWDSRVGAIRSKDLRVPLGQIVSDYMGRERRRAKGIVLGIPAKIRQMLDRTETTAGRTWMETPNGRALAQHFLEVTEDAPKRKPGRPAWPASHYAEVAGTYIAALSYGVNPTAAVMGRFHVSKSTAAKWIYRCRRPPLNLLAPTVRGRAAGATQEPDDELPKPRRKP
ncbi:MAG TPA: hypothetical protein VNH38_02155 [Candidatus Dormibacteraeota bacterium]|nr:hypothetical protein [Candidatus Dormibacteraeota bacterium]